MELEKGQLLGRVVLVLGNNLYRINTTDDYFVQQEANYLLPKRLRNFIYIRPRSIVIVEKYEHPQGKVMGEIMETFLPEQVKLLRKLPQWPEEWNDCVD